LLGEVYFSADEFNYVDARPNVVPLVGQRISLGLARCNHNPGYNLRLLSTKA
jgi:hypothetical protein